MDMWFWLYVLIIFFSGFSDVFSLNLTVNLFSTKYQKYTSGCPKLPEQMRTKVCSMDDLPCYNVDACANDDDDDEEASLLQESTEEESTRAAGKGEDSYSNKDSSEENIHHQMSQRDDDGVESRGCFAKNWVGGPMNSPPVREVDQEKHFTINDSPARTPILLASSYIAENSQIPGLIELTRELDQPVKKQPTTASAGDKDEMLIKSPDITSHEVEIIDIFTPSPCYRVNASSKKRRPTVCPEIIDLTNSPMYV